jgi:hypothetical protein
MQKFTAGCLLGAAILVFVSAGCTVATMGGEKHTGPITVRNEWQGHFELIRANGEFFEMSFDPHYLGPQIHKGDVLGDLVYTDAKNHEEFFVKATLVMEAAPSPPADEILYDQTGYYYTCGYENTCEFKAPESRKFYLWKDGGYRAKPESVK